MSKADRDINKLKPEFKKKVKLFLKEVGDKIFITEAYRSQERQNELYAQGRTKPWNKVTWTLKSEHTKWTAIDIAFQGKDLYPSDIYTWKEVAEVAKKYGIDWGYDLWKTDKPHFQDNGKPLETMWEYEKLFKAWENDWNSHVLRDIEWWIQKTGIDRELAFSLLIMFNRTK